MEIKYLKSFQKALEKDWKKKKEPLHKYCGLSLAQIEILEAYYYPDGKWQFPKVLREMLYLDGVGSTLFDTGCFMFTDNRDDLELESLLDMQSDNSFFSRNEEHFLEWNPFGDRPIWVFGTAYESSDNFEFVYLDEYEEDPWVYYFEMDDGYDNGSKEVIFESYPYNDYPRLRLSEVIFSYEKGPDFRFPKEHKSKEKVETRKEIDPIVQAWKLAAKNGNQKEIEKLLAQGIDIHSDDDYALRWTVINKHYDISLFLLKHGADANVDRQFILTTLAKRGELDLIKKFENFGLKIANANMSLNVAIRNKHSETVKYIFDKGTVITDEYRDSIFQLVLLGNVDLLKVALKKSKWLYNSQEDHSSLSGAIAKSNSPDMLEFLLKTQKNIYNCLFYVLWYSLCEGREELANYILSKNLIDFNNCPKFSYLNKSKASIPTAKLIIERVGTRMFEEDFIRWEIQKGNIEFLELWVQHATDEQIQRIGPLALKSAAFMRQSKIMKLLVNADLQINNQTLLEIVVSSENGEAAIILLDKQVETKYSDLEKYFCTRHTSLADLEIFLKQLGKSAELIEYWGYIYQLKTLWKSWQRPNPKETRIGIDEFEEGAYLTLKGLMDFRNRVGFNSLSRIVAEMYPVRSSSYSYYVNYPFHYKIETINHPESARFKKLFPETHPNLKLFLLEIEQLIINHKGKKAVELLEKNLRKKQLIDNGKNGEEQYFAIEEDLHVENPFNYPESKILKSIKESKSREVLIFLLDNYTDIEFAEYLLQIFRYESSFWVYPEVLISVFTRPQKFELTNDLIVRFCKGAFSIDEKRIKLILSDKRVKEIPSTVLSKIILLWICHAVYYNKIELYNSIDECLISMPQVIKHDYAEIQNFIIRKEISYSGKSYLRDPFEHFSHLQEIETGIDIDDFNSLLNDTQKINYIFSAIKGNVEDAGKRKELLRMIVSGSQLWSDLEDEVTEIGYTRGRPESNIFLLLSIEMQNFGLLNHLLQKGADPNTENGRALLFAAKVPKKNELFERLIFHGAVFPKDAKLVDQIESIGSISNFKLLYRRLADNLISTINGFQLTEQQKLSISNSKLQRIGSESNQANVHSLIYSNDNKKAKQLLREFVFEQTVLNRAMINACCSINREKIELLLAEGANINTEDGICFALAIERGEYEFAKWLVQTHHANRTYNHGYTHLFAYQVKLDPETWKVLFSGYTLKKRIWIVNRKHRKNMERLKEFIHVKDG